MSGAMFFLSLIGYAFLAMLAFPRLKAGPALLSGLCAMLFLSYTFVILLQWMVPTAYLLLIAGWMFLAAGVATALMGKRNLRSRLHSVGLWYFVLLSVALMLVTRNTLIADHDSLAYWARAVRELYVFDRFYIHGDATMFHMDYIPLLASLQYCVMRVFGWKDAYLLYVTFACIAASAAAMVDVSSRRLPVRIVTAVVLACAFLALGQSVLTTRADVPMLAVFSGGICCLFLRMDDSADSVLTLRNCRRRADRVQDLFRPALLAHSFRRIACRVAHGSPTEQSRPCSSQRVLDSYRACRHGAAILVGFVCLLLGTGQL